MLTPGRSLTQLGSKSSKSIRPVPILRALQASSSAKAFLHQAVKMFETDEGNARNGKASRGHAASSGLGELQQELDLRVFIEVWESQTHLVEQ